MNFNKSAPKVQIFLYMSIFYCTFAVANSRWGVCIDVATWVSRHIEWRLLTLDFDHLKPRKLQIVIFENK